MNISNILYTQTNTSLQQVGFFFFPAILDLFKFVTTTFSQFLLLFFQLFKFKANIQ